MKNLDSKKFLETLKAETRQYILTLNRLRQEDPENLLEQPSTDKWSVAQVLEHLNTYSRYYLPLIASKINENREKPERVFESGWLGSYFIKSMLPKAGKVTNKMKAPKGHRPVSDLDNKVVLDEFEKHQQHLLQLLEKAENRNLNKIRIPISISWFIKINLGDTFGFLIAHQQRHFVQIANTLNAVKQNKVTA